MLILTPIVIDLANLNPLPILNAKQGDTGRGIRATVTIDGQVCRFTSEEVNVFIRKPDGKLIYNTCEIEGGNIVATLTNQALAVPGRLQAELEILSGEERISTPIALIDVLPTNIDGKAIESTNEFGRYETIIKEMNTAEAERKEAEASRVMEEDAREEAEAERVLAETMRQQAESVRATEETARSEAESLRIQTEELRRQAEEARVAAEAIREEVKAAAEAAAEAAGEAAERANEAATGGVSKMIVNYEEPEILESPESGETVGTLFGKMSGWIRRFRTELNDNVLLRAYPVGTIYMSTNEVNPGTLFGGTWEAWGSGRMPMSVNASDSNFNEVEKEGGSISHTHASPQHTHGINAHSHTMAHTHTINSHSHTMAHTHTGPSHTHTTGDCTLTINQIPAHRHNVELGYELESNYNNLFKVGFGTAGFRTLASSSQGGGAAHNHGSTGASGTGNTGGASVDNTGGSGTLTSNGSGAANTGGATLTTNNSDAANTGSASSLPPYITCYMWKRVA